MNEDLQRCKLREIRPLTMEDIAPFFKGSEEKGHVVPTRARLMDDFIRKRVALPINQPAQAGGMKSLHRARWTR